MMKRLSGSMFVLIVAAMLIAGCGSNNRAPASAARTTTLSGTIYAPQGTDVARTAGREAYASAIGQDVPVPGARVSAYRMKSDGTLDEITAISVNTLANGTYTLTGVPQEDNIVIVATKNVTVGGVAKSLSVKKVVSVSSADVDAGAKTGVDSNASTTLAAEAMKDIVVAANAGKPENQKISASSLPHETMTDIETKIETALTADQGEGAPAVDLLGSVTGGELGMDEQLAALENSPDGAEVKSTKDNAMTKGSVRIHVVQINDQGPPLAGATVILTSDGMVQTKITDATGDAFFDGIASGSTLDVEVRKNGFLLVKTSQNIDRAAMVNNVTVHMTQTNTNQAPVAKAGPNQNVGQGAVVTLSGSASFDPDGSTITYLWTQTAGTTVSLSSTTAASVTFTASQIGTYTFSLVVRDASLNSVSDTVSVIVAAPVCGNSATESGESCDDGNAVTEACAYGLTSCAVCNSTCQSAAGATAFCGNGAINTTGGETCDDGVDNGKPNHCNLTCGATTAPVCGNSSTESGETCDDGNTVTETCAYDLTSCSICNSTCHSAAGSTSFCGDSITNASNGETCDDGNSVTENCPLGQNSCVICNASCHSVAGADVTPPTVTTVVPLSNATNVPVSTNIITAAFSEPMSSTTIAATSFTLACPSGTPVSGAVATYSSTGNLATLTLSSASSLPESTICAATISTTAKDVAGNSLAANYVWTFATGVAPDATRPTVTITNPADADTGVPVNKTISATFSEAMDPLTIGTTNFTVGAGISGVPGTVAYNATSRIATFTPSSNLSPNTLYTATIATTATDLAGNALLSNKNWSFTTGTLAAQTVAQAMVPLGSASDFAILASASITNIPTSMIRGNIGLTPDSGANITGFSSPATCPEVMIGIVYAVDAAGPACALISPTILAGAKADALAAYEDARASTRGTPTSISGNINGLTLYPGLYESGTSIEISAGGSLYLDAQGDSNAVFIIRSATSITTSSTSEVVLTNGAKASNIFWTAGSAITLGSNSKMKGTLIAGTSVTLQTGSDLEGRALNQGPSAAAVACDTCTIIIPTP